MRLDYSLKLYIIMHMRLDYSVKFEVRKLSATSGVEFSSLRYSVHFYICELEDQSSEEVNDAVAALQTSEDDRRRAGR